MKINNLFLMLFTFITLISLSSCIGDGAIKELNTGDYLPVKTGDILVMSVTTRSVVHLDKDGHFIDTIYIAPVGQTLKAIAWDSSTRSVLIGITAGASRVISISSIDKTERIISTDTNLSTALSSLFKTPSNEYIFTGAVSTIRKLNFQGVNKIAPPYPLASGHSGTMGQLSLTQEGNILSCSSTGAFVRLFSETGVTLQTSAGSGVPGTNAAYGCLELPNGKIAVAWNGTTDTIAIYDKDNLNLPLFSFTDTSILPSPRAIAVSANGNILVVDSLNHLIVEISPKGEFIKTLGEGLFSGATHIVTVK